MEYYFRFNDIQTKIDDYVERNLVQKLHIKHIVKGAICLAKYLNTDL